MSSETKAQIDGDLSFVGDLAGANLEQVVFEFGGEFIKKGFKFGWVGHGRDAKQWRERC